MSAAETDPDETWTPLVTALVPTYNGAEFIQRTLDSLAAQSWSNLEILIGDDASTDDTLEIVRRFAADHPRTRVLARESNLGWLGNSNDLMSHAEGELQFFAFHDDVVAPTYVERLVAALHDERAVLAFSDMVVHEVGGPGVVHAFDQLEGLHSAVARGRVMVRRADAWWVPNRGLFRTAAYRAVGGIRPNDRGEYSADWTWLLGLSLVGEFVRVPEVLCTKYYTSGSLSKTWPHDASQVHALQRSGIAEIRHSALPATHKAIVAAHLLRRVYGARLPPRLKRVLLRMGL